MHESTLSVVVPCHNEEAAISAVIASLHRALGGRYAYELIVVDDGSNDSSVKKLESAQGRSLHMVRHDRKRGYGAALKSGIRKAGNDLIVIIDADGSYPADRIPDLIVRAAEADMVVGARTGTMASYPVLRRLPKVILRSYASWLVGQDIPDLNSGLRVVRRSDVRRFLNILPDGFSFTSTLTIAMLRTGGVVEFVPIDYGERVGRSKIRPFRDTVNFVQLILRTGTYFAPLRVFLPLAAVLFLMFIASAAYDIFILRNLTDKTILFVLFAMNTAMFALLADMIDKRGSS